MVQTFWLTGMGFRFSKRMGKGFGKGRGMVLVLFGGRKAFSNFWTPNVPNSLL